MIRFCPMKIYFQEDPFKDTCYIPVRTDFNSYQEYTELIDFLIKNNFEQINTDTHNSAERIFITPELKRFWICDFMSGKYCNIRGDISGKNFIRQYPNIILENDYTDRIDFDKNYITEFFQLAVKENFKIRL